jgi:hypothetical protein
MMVQPFKNPVICHRYTRGPVGHCECSTQPAGVDVNAGITFMVMVVDDRKTDAMRASQPDDCRLD